MVLHGPTSCSIALKRVLLRGEQTDTLVHIPVCEPVPLNQFRQFLAKQDVVHTLEIAIIAPRFIAGVEGVGADTGLRGEQAAVGDELAQRVLPALITDSLAQDARRYLEALVLPGEVARFGWKNGMRQAAYIEDALAIVEQPSWITEGIFLVWTDPLLYHADYNASGI